VRDSRDNNNSTAAALVLVLFLQYDQASNKHNEHILKTFENSTRKRRAIQGGSNHALDTMLESEMQNRETQSDG
jgi:ABC-type uncharacterized transport system auxiliary subunit